MLRLTKILALIAFLAFALPGCGSDGDTVATSGGQTDGQEQASAAVKELDVPELSNDGLAQILAESKGKVVFLCFWSVTCPACDKEIPELEALVGEYPDEMRMLLVNVDPTARNVPAYFGDYTPVSEVYHGTNDLVEAFGVYKIPHLVMFTAEGEKLLDKSGYFPSKMLEALVEHGLGRGMGGMSGSMQGDS